MRSNIKRALVATAFAAFIATGLLAWAAPGHGGGHGGSGGHVSGGHSSGGHMSGGHGGSVGHMSGGHSSFNHSSGGHISGIHSSGGHGYAGSHYSGNHSFAGVKYSNGFGHINNNNFGHGAHNYGNYANYGRGVHNYGNYGNYGRGYRNYGNYANYGRGYYNYGRYYRSWPYRAYAYGNYWRYYRPYIYNLGYYGYPYLSSYFGYPSSYYYNSYPAYYSSYPTYNDSYAPNYYGNSAEELPGDAYANVPPPSGNVGNRSAGDTARIEIRLPDPQASIWVEGQSIASSGEVRQFNSPQLDPSRQFSYDVKAAWIENGKLMTDERRVKVRANAQSVIDFTKPGQTAPDAGQLPPPVPLPPQQDT